MSISNDLNKREITTPREWRQALEQLPNPHLLQSWEWGAFKGNHYWQPQYWLWEAAGNPQAAALLLSRKAGRLPARVMYVPKGPTLDYDNLPLLTQVLSELQNLARKARAIFVKIDPDVPVDDPRGETLTSLLSQKGWRFSQEQIQFRNTMLLDLSPDTDEILAKMKSKWRYNIRLAERKAVQVRLGELEDLPLLYRLYQETSLRDQFVIRPESYYQDAWGRFIQAGLAQPLIAEVEKEPVAMVILFRSKQRTWYMYGASRSLHRERMPNHLLQWRSILWAKEQGCTIYDFWGAPDVLDASDPMWGVYRFKKGFGAQLVRHIGAYDYPTSPLLYGLYTTILPRLLTLMRRRHWQYQRKENITQ